MAKLLQTAVSESQSPNDKFVFLSETTLPVKPFAFIYQSLTVDQNSDFCIATTDQWARLASKNIGESAVLVKHSQWTVLSRYHAELVVQRWPIVMGGGQYWSVPVWPQSAAASYDAGEFASVSRTVQLCTDE